MDAAIRGGFKIVEFTLTTPGCLDAIRQFRAVHGDDILVGCGTVMNEADAEAGLEAGADFLVSPVFHPELLRWCETRDVFFIPGCATPTECFAAYRAGARIQKLFPGVAGGPEWVRATAAALPMLSLYPTSGVTLENAAEHIRNGAIAVGLVAPLFPADSIQAADWQVIEHNARTVIERIGNVPRR